MFLYLKSQLGKQPVFEVVGTGLGVHDNALNLLHLRSDVALAAYKRLLSDIFRRRKIYLRSAYLYVVSEDLVVTYFEIFDAGTLALACFKPCDPFSAIPRRVDYIIKLF